MRMISTTRPITLIGSENLERHPTLILVPRLTTQGMTNLVSGDIWVATYLEKFWGNKDYIHEIENNWGTFDRGNNYTIYKIEKKLIEGTTVIFTKLRKIEKKWLGKQLQYLQNWEKVDWGNNYNIHELKNSWEFSQFCPKEAMHLIFPNFSLASFNKLWKLCMKKVYDFYLGWRL